MCVYNIDPHTYKVFFVYNIDPHTHKVVFVKISHNINKSRIQKKME